MEFRTKKIKQSYVGNSRHFAFHIGFGQLSLVFYLGVVALHPLLVFLNFFVVQQLASGRLLYADKHKEIYGETLFLLHETFESLCSETEHPSMKVDAMILRKESTETDL